MSSLLYVLLPVTMRTGCKVEDFQLASFVGSEVLPMKVNHAQEAVMHLITKIN